MRRPTASRYALDADGLLEVIEGELSRYLCLVAAGKQAQAALVRAGIDHLTRLCAQLHEREEGDGG